MYQTSPVQYQMISPSLQATSDFGLFELTHRVLTRQLDLGLSAHEWQHYSRKCSQWVVLHQKGSLVAPSQLSLYHQGHKKVLTCQLPCQQHE